MDEKTFLIDTVNDFVSIGQKRLEDGTYLIGKVPHVAPKAWLHAIYPPMQGELSIQVPSLYLQFLKQINGASLFSGTLDLFGKRNNYNRDEISVWQPFDIVKPNTIERLHDAKPDYFFFGFYDWDGSLLYFDEKNKIHRCSSDSSIPLNTWSSFSDFLKSEMSRISLLFDENGREIDENVPTCPTS